MPSNARKNTPATPQILGDAMRQGGGGGKVAPPSGGLAASMNIYFNTFYWEFTSLQMSILVAGVFLSAFIALAAAAPLSRRFGKRATAMTLTALSVTLGVTPMLLRVAVIVIFPSPSPGS